jgi:hypothetical protein
MAWPQKAATTNMMVQIRSVEKSLEADTLIVRSERLSDPAERHISHTMEMMLVDLS